MKEINIEKPENWPINQREANLEDIYCAIVSFINEPTYRSKEILFSLVTQSDLNEINNTGEVRYTKYEVSMINSIYTYATTLSCDSIKIYLYRFLALTASNHKMMYYICKQMGMKISGVNSSFFIEEYGYLHPALKMFYLSYSKFNYEKTQPLCDSIIEFINDSLKEIEKGKVTRNKAIFSLAHSFILMLKDLSTCKSSKIFGVVSFTRKELSKLFELESQLIDLSNQNPYERPLRSVILLSIRNWIMRSRSNYYEGHFYKCISDENAEIALNNHEVWMKKIEKLNDPREMHILTELISDNDWAEYDWAKNIQINIPKNHFVCSYTKTLPNESMKQEYGNNVFGYKNDRISDILTPIEFYNNKHVLLGDVVFYDVIYSKDEAKEELKYLCNLINLFSFNEIQKNKFLNEILQYWYLSFKDENWKDENERRYHIVLHKNISCLESKIEGDFYKSKTSLYLYPDFLFGSEKIKDTIKLNREEKLKSISTKNYLFCNNCLQSDFDYSSLGSKAKCRICGSSDISYIEVI